MAQSLYALLKNTKPDAIAWKDQDDLAFNTRKESLINSPALGHLNYKLPFFLFIYEDGSTLGVLTQKHGDHYCPIEYYSQQLSTAVKYTVKYYGLALVQGYPPHFRAIPATVFLVKAARETAMRSPLTIFVHHAVEALLNSQHTQQLSASCLTSC